MHMSFILFKLHIQIPRVPRLWVYCCHLWDVYWLIWTHRTLAQQDHTQKERYLLHLLLYGYCISIIILLLTVKLIIADHIYLLTQAQSLLAEMKRSKKSNNIFNRPILPQSLFYQQVQKDYNIGGVKVQGCWLKDSPPQVYQSSVKSALELSDLKAQLTQLKKSSNHSTADLFRMAELKRKMENFQMLVQSPTKKKEPEKQLKIHAENLMLQKVSNFWGLFTRNCRIEEKQLSVMSQKQKKQKKIDLKPYTIQKQQKGKQNPSSKQFTWPENSSHIRLFLHGQNLRPYCIYGEESVLKNIQKTIKIQSIKIAEIDFFKKLSKQFEQKIIILFGNRLRVYEHYLKETQKHNLNIAFDLIEKSHILDQIEEEASIIEKGKTGEKVGSILDESLNHSQSSRRDMSNKNSLNKSASFLNNSALSPMLTPSKSPPPLTQSQFKLKSRRSTINYQDLDNDEEDENVNLQDFKLQIKEVAHSDSEEESDAFQQRNQNNGNLQKSSEIGKRRTFDPNKKFSEEIVIPQFAHEQSASDDSSVYFQKKQKIRKQIKSTKEQFQIFQAPMTHYMSILYFQDFCSYSQNQLELSIYQLVIPQIEYQNMKTPVCQLKKFVLKRNPQIPRLFEAQNPICFPLSIKGNQIWLLLDNVTSQLKQKMQLQLKNIRYAVDKSQLIYIKKQNLITCAGKLKVIVSNQKINVEQFKQETTIQFLDKYLIKEVYKREDKYKFIDYKKKNHQICQKWNNKMMKKIINRGDQHEFMKAVFNGFPASILEKIVNFKPLRSISRAETRIESSSSLFSTATYNLMQTQIMKMKAYDLRVFLKLNNLIEIIVNSKKNACLQKRIDDICMFYSFKFGKSSVEKILAVFVIEVLRKTEILLLHLTYAKQIQIFFVEYFEVQFQIDDLMNNVSAYFN